MNLKSKFLKFHKFPRSHKFSKSYKFPGFYKKKLLIIIIIIYSIFIKNVFKNNAFKKSTLKKFIFYIKNSNLSLRSRVININKYRFIYINIKDVIIFIFLKIKEIYNSRY